MYSDSDLQRVFFVHEGLFVVLCYGDTSYQFACTHAYFVSRKSKRVIHLMKGLFTKHIVIKPAEIMILDGMDYIKHWSPRFDQAIEERISLGKSGIENILWAAYRGDMDTVFSILESKKIDLPYQCDGPYCEFTCYGGQWICRYIINGGSISALATLLHRDASFADDDALRFAISARRIDMMKLLLEHKANPASDNSDILHFAIASSSATREIVQLLLESGAKVEDANKPLGPYGLPRVLLHKSTTEWTPKDVYDFFVESGMKVPP